MCDLGYLIQDHLPALMQLMTYDQRSVMTTETTKCLNTAVMITHLMLGPERAAPVTAACDVHVVRRSALAGKHPGNPAVAASLKERVLMTGGKRAIFYVMITDAAAMPLEPAAMPLKLQPAAVPTQHFPGHVFVVERLPRGTFNVYQSYIRSYSMAGHLDRWRKSLSVSRARMTKLLEGLSVLGGSRVWDAPCTAFWQDLTGVDESRFEGYALTGHVHLCFQEVESDSCIGNLRKFVDSKLHEIDHMDAVAGRRTASPHTRPLTVNEMRKELLALRGKL